MYNFEFRCPTKLIFGKGTISKIKDEIPRDAKVLMTYGGGSIMKNGVYEQVKAALKGFDVIEFGGIEPNPTYETCMEAVEIVKREGVDFLLAVGGGSVLDGTKFIAAAAKFEGAAPWDILAKDAPVLNSISLASVITLPATGSEMNCGAVISRKSTNEKLAFIVPQSYPQFSVVDPETTYSLPPKQTSNGIVDTFVHVCEQYATYDVNTPLQDDWALGVLRTLIKEAPKVLTNPHDYDARANIFWAATCGLNYWISLGCVQDWSTHMIGHEITAFYGLDHGETLAIIMPRLWENRFEAKKAKLAKMGREVYGCESPDDELSAKFAILKTEEFFNSIGKKTKLADYGVDAKEAAERVFERFRVRGTILGEDGKITPEVTRDILRTC